MLLRMGVRPVRKHCALLDQLLPELAVHFNCAERGDEVPLRVHRCALKADMVAWSDNEDIVVRFRRIDLMKPRGRHLAGVDVPGMWNNNGGDILRLPGGNRTRKHASEHLFQFVGFRRIELTGDSRLAVDNGLLRRRCDRQEEEQKGNMDAGEQGSSFARSSLGGSKQEARPLQIYAAAG